MNASELARKIGSFTTVLGDSPELLSQLKEILEALIAVVTDITIKKIASASSGNDTVRAAFRELREVAPEQHEGHAAFATICEQVTGFEEFHILTQLIRRLPSDE